MEGCGIVETAGQRSVTLTKGDAVVIPANLEGFTVRPQWAVEFLKAFVPGAARACHAPVKADNHRAVQRTPLCTSVSPVVKVLPRK